LTSVVVNYNTKKSPVNTPCHQSWVCGEATAWFHRAIARLASPYLRT